MCSLASLVVPIVLSTVQSVHKRNVISFDTSLYQFCILDPPIYNVSVQSLYHIKQYRISAFQKI